MAKLRVEPKLEISYTIELTEKEAQALKFLSEFDTKDVLKKLTGQFSRNFHLAEDRDSSGEHAEGMKTFLESIKTMGGLLKRSETAREVLAGKKIKNLENVT